jgi:hypothetical protein
VIPAPAGSTFPYKLDIKGPETLSAGTSCTDTQIDKHVLTEDELKTQECVSTSNLRFQFTHNPRQIRQGGIPLRLICCYPDTRRLHHLLTSIREPPRMVQLHHINTYVLCLYVRICPSPSYFLAICVELTISRITARTAVNYQLASQECCPYADESNDIQDIEYCSG